MGGRVGGKQASPGVLEFTESVLPPAGAYTGLGTHIGSHLSIRMDLTPCLASIDGTVGIARGMASQLSKLCGKHTHCKPYKTA